MKDENSLFANRFRPHPSSFILYKEKPRHNAEASIPHWVQQYYTPFYAVWQIAPNFSLPPLASGSPRACLCLASESVGR